ncbi:ribosome small subunit-dependent GTPase A [Pseudoduganella violacea]|uniref:Small ribosomal subunit biogenesis GTPase RsgA n=1 Tax=Pseudoduganella violacea TaxID=1715466 RepID=A0A7W5B6D5_9BURK|nr:ribosome small subunit-dependent GTPase A [Pseudoduganella violacea]MBB3117243.1 ribosome biogenesis GTPase [Pseudoduganella violacea]
MIEFDFAVLRRIGLNNSILAQLSMAEAAPGAQLMRLTEVQRDWQTVHDGQAEHRARALPRLLSSLQEQGSGLAVGDWVVVESHAHGELWISRRLSPFTHIARRANDGRRQPLASNIDTALLVMGLDNDFNPRRVERYIALVQAAEVAPVVVLSKTDLGIDVDNRIAELRQRLPSYIPIVAINSLSMMANTELKPWLGNGQTICLLGASGTGKSTLTNTLTSAHQETGGNRKSDGRGRHTTTARSLHICPDGGCIIDTPGLRTWRPDADGETLAATFDDIESLAAHCQFHDCRHEAEPGCAVREQIDPDRLLNYHKLLRDVQRSQQTPLDKISARAKWKVIIKAARTRGRDKRSV